MTVNTMYLWDVPTSGALGLKQYFIITAKGGLPGEMEAKERAVAAYNRELEKEKDRTIASKPKQVETIA